MNRSRFELVANVCSVVNTYAKIYFVHVFYWKRINIVWKYFQCELFNCLISLRIFIYPNYVTKNNSDNVPVSGLSRILGDQISLFLPSATKLRRLCFYTCLSFCSQAGEGSASVHAGIPHPPGSTPPGRRLPLRTVRILLECILMSGLLLSTVLSLLPSIDP